MKKYVMKERFWCGLLLSLLAACGHLKAATNNPPAIPWTQIGAAAGADYRGDGLSVTPTESGARLHCVFQRMDGEITPQGLRLISTDTNRTRDCFGVRAMEIRRRPADAVFGSFGPQWPECDPELCAPGVVSIKGQSVRFSRPGLTEEYSVSMDGLRQDFIVEQAPPGPPTGELVVKLAVSGAKVEVAPYGATLALEQSGRRIAYSRLRVIDARGKELPARIEVARASEGQGSFPTIGSASFEEEMSFHAPLCSDAMLAVVVDDADAAYPVRIDPTFSDANWVSMGDHLGANSLVYTAILDGSGNLYIGGLFDAVGGTLAGVAKWNGSSWSALGSETGSPRIVYALAVSGTNVYAGGWFTMAEGTIVNYVAQWNGSTWLPMGAGMNNYVYALAVSGDTLYAGGYFSKADGKQVNYVAQWDGSSWSALGTGMNSSVLALAVSGGRLYAGGSFTAAGAELTNANYIAQWDGTNWSALGSGMNNSVLALAASGGTLYAGGNFTTAGVDTNANYVAQWDGAHWSALGSGMSGFVSALAVSGNALYAGGQFATAGGTNVHSIAQWNGTKWTSLGPGMDGSVNALAVSGNTLYALGNFHFTSDAVVALNGIAQWHGTSWAAVGSGMNSAVYAFAVSGSTLFAGGSFTTAGDVTNANYVAQWDGTRWSALGSGMSGGVFALAVSGSTLYAGGGFAKADGSNVFFVAQWNGSHWSGLGPGLSATVSALAVSGGTLYAGGQFKNVRNNTSVHLNGIAQWNGSSWSPLSSGMGGGAPYVSALAVLGGTLYAGGQFTTAGSVTNANYIAQWDGNNWLSVGSGMGTKIIADRGYVNALTVSGSTLYAGGAFTLAGGNPANYIAQWDGTKWSPLGSGVGGADPSVSALAASGGTLYVGGGFTTAGGNPASYIAQWDGNNWLPLGSGMNKPVNVLAATSSTLYVGGDFITAGGKVSAYAAMASLGASGPVIPQDAALGFTNGVFGFNISGPAGSGITIDYSTNLQNWIPLQTNLLGNAPFYFTDPQSTAAQQRFYRARLLP
jgi:hypothetical protein